MYANKGNAQAQHRLDSARRSLKAVGFTLRRLEQDHKAMPQNWGVVGDIGRIDDVLSRLYDEYE